MWATDFRQAGCSTMPQNSKLSNHHDKTNTAISIFLFFFFYTRVLYTKHSHCQTSLHPFHHVRFLSICTQRYLKELTYLITWHNCWVVASDSWSNTSSLFLCVEDKKEKCTWQRVRQDPVHSDPEWYHFFLIFLNNFGTVKNCRVWNTKLKSTSTSPAWSLQFSWGLVIMRTVLCIWKHIMYVVNLLKYIQLNFKPLWLPDFFGVNV